ncbi:hypothetical protein [Aliarcobacter butzleri]|uniref:hypothetical protein n=1 Tax=Aliarcobacter butzleri TaxID=28197 RepID=UPI0013E0CE81|nr:hypothetical protein [Aliarcobacter butzleri]MDK2050932.1 hypothetical protein [Aliarcobacter butzleri]
MNENQINKAIKEMLLKNKEYINKNVTVVFDAKELEKKIKKEVDSLQALLKNKKF